MPQEGNIPLMDLVFSLADMTDLVSPDLVNHHFEVAYIAGELAGEAGLSAARRAELVTAGALHDIGALSLAEKLGAMQFEASNPHRHAEMSYRLLKTFTPFDELARLVRYHHARWDGGGTGPDRRDVPLGSHILHLADRVAVLKDKRSHILNQSGRIREKIKKESGAMFHPDLVDAFLRASEKPAFWLSVESPRAELARPRDGNGQVLRLDSCELLALTRLFAHIIDFRSQFTATHSAGVAAVAKALAGLAGLSVRECGLMEIAGHLHDLGKLAIPAEILDKEEPLTREEFNVIYSHPFHTGRALRRIRGLSAVTTWAADHHERLDGRGYPYRLPAGDLPLGSRITAVADVFTAIVEGRPYQEKMGPETAISIIGQLAEKSQLDPALAELLAANSTHIDAERAQVQASAEREYEEFYRSGGADIDGKCRPEREGAASGARQGGL